ncbi:MAG: response regulator [bacterium]
MHILVADDNPAFMDLLKEYLEEKGHSVEIASDGKALLEKMKITTPDVIISDLEMPEMGGGMVQTMLNMGGKTAVIPLIIITGQPKQRVEREINFMTVAAILTKPIKLEELDRILAKLEQQDKI